jgi:hypothetical protein
MALKERTVTDKIEIVGEFKHIQVRQAVQIYDSISNEVKAQSYHRAVVMCGDNVAAAEYGVADLASVVWSNEVKAAYAASLTPVE